MTARTPRTMSETEERTIRNAEYADKCHGPIVNQLFAEIYAEREVSRKLAEALKKARQTLFECAEDTIGTPTESLFRAEVAQCDAALAQYTATQNLASSEGLSTDTVPPQGGRD